MIITTNNSTKHRLILEYSSYAKKDIQVSLGLTVKFIHAFQRWLHHRDTLNVSAFNYSSMGSRLTTRGDSPATWSQKSLKAKDLPLQKKVVSKRNRLLLWRFAEKLAHHNGRSCYPSSKKRHTVIRSAFVYKKTREQFGLQKHTYRLNFELTKCQQNLFVAWASQLKLPAELVVSLQ